MYNRVLRITRASGCLEVSSLKAGQSDAGYVKYDKKVSRSIPLHASVRCSIKLTKIFSYKDLLKAEDDLVQSCFIYYLKQAIALLTLNFIRLDHQTLRRSLKKFKTVLVM